MKDLIIIGTGGVGREVASIVEEINEINPSYNILGFIDDDIKKKDKTINGYKVIGSIEYLNKGYKGEVTIAIANYQNKKSIVNTIEQLGIKFATIVHPTVKIHHSVSIDYGTIIYRNVNISPNVEIGKYNIISSKSLIGHDCALKDYVSLFWDVNISGNNVIEEGSLIQTGAIISQGANLGKCTIVQPGTVIINSIGD